MIYMIVLKAVNSIFKGEQYIYDYPMNEVINRKTLFKNLMEDDVFPEELVQIIEIDLEAGTSEDITEFMADWLEEEYEDGYYDDSEHKIGKFEALN